MSTNFHTLTQSRPWAVTLSSANGPAPEDCGRGENMRTRICLLLLVPVAGALATNARADTVILTVGAGGQYQRVSSAVSAADADTNPSGYYDIRVLPGTYINDFPYVTRPMTIEVDPLHAGKRVTLKATEDLPNEKGIILTTASLTVKRPDLHGREDQRCAGRQRCWHPRSNYRPGRQPDGSE